MKRNRKRTVAILLAATLGAILGAGAAMAQAPAGAAAPATKEAQKQGTGVVPPGVKLEAQIPPAGPARPFHFPQVSTKTLANGLRVFVVTNSAEPAVAAQLVLTSAGAIHNPEGLPGVAEMTADMLTQGTERRSAQDIAEAIDFVGGTIHASSGADGTYISISVVKKDLELGMDLLSDVVLHPAFKKEELDRQKQQLLSSLQVAYNDPDFLVRTVFSRVVLSPSPYALPGDGTPTTAEKLDRGQLVSFHDSYYVPDGALLAFAGDITPEAAFAIAEKYFGAWPKKELPAMRVAAPVPVRGLHIYIVDKPDAVQTQILAGSLGIQRNDPNYIPLLVTNRIFGGGYNSRLNTEVRINKGLTYGANSRFESMQHAGAFSAGTFTRTEATVEATKLVLDLVGKMGSGGITQAELNFARDYQAGVFPIQAETATQVAGMVLVVAQYGLPADYNSTYQQNILAVTPEKVKELAGRYFDEKNMDLVLVGNAGKFRDDLKKAFPGASTVEIPLAELDVLSADLHRAKEAPVPVAAATPESLARGSALLKAGLAVAGGGDAFAKAESLEVSSTGTAAGPGGQDMQISIRTVMVYPDKIRSDVKLPMATIAQGYDGKSGWLASPQGVSDIPPESSTDFFRALAFTGTIGFFRQAAAGKIELQSLGEQEIGGKKTEGALWNSPFGAVKVYFDPETHLLAAAHFHQPGQQGPVEVEQRWSGYKTVEGMQIPFVSDVYRSEAKFTSLTIQEIKLNTKPDLAQFAKPAPAPKPAPAEQPKP